MLRAGLDLQTEPSGLMSAWLLPVPEHISHVPEHVFVCVHVCLNACVGIKRCMCISRCRLYLCASVGLQCTHVSVSACTFPPESVCVPSLCTSSRVCECVLSSEPLTLLSVSVDMTQVFCGIHPCHCASVSAFMFFPAPCTSLSQAHYL